MKHVTFWRHIAVILAYTALTLGMTWPAIIHFKDGIVGSGGDPWQTLWRFEDKSRQLTQAFTQGELGSFIQYEFLGGGEARLVNLATWPWAPLYVLLGLPTTYNVVWFLSFIIAGYAVYLLTLTLWRPSAEQKERSWLLVHAPAFLAGLYYMFLPYHVAHAQGHFGAMQMAWLPLIIWSVIQLFRTHNVWFAALLGIGLTIQAWSEHHYMLWLLVFSIIALLFFWKEVNVYFSRPAHRWLAGALIVWVFVSILLPYYPTIRLAGNGSSLLDLGEEQTMRFSSDVFSFIFPASFHPVWGGVFGSFFMREAGNINVAESTYYLGWVVLLLLLFFHQRLARRTKRFWLLVGGVFFVIALGPSLHVLGRELGVPLPYALIQHLPIFSAVRTVGRASVLIGLSGAVLLAGVLATHVKRVQGVIILLLVILLDFLFFPVTIQSATLSFGYELVRNAPGSRVIEIPATTNYTAASRALYASNHHGKEVLGNIALERASGEAELTFVRSVPAIRQLLYVGTSTFRRDRDDFFAQNLSETLSDTLRYFDVGSIVIHPDSLSVLQLTTLRHFLEEDMGFVANVVDDVLVYTFDPAALAVPGDGVFLTRDSHWLHVGFDPKRNSVFAEVEEAATVTVVNTTTATRQVDLGFNTFSESPSSLVVKDMTGQVLSIVPPGDERSILLDIAPGSQTYTFSPEGAKAVLQNPYLRVVR